ncbi:toll/interleukin-1 receptor domain-containing protein [bacterium]|nr:toll/interleukin-1 receptor domain-containing protein [bacterium]
MNAKQGSSKTGAWIFVSHSHRDLGQVRQIRNELEKLGHNPLLFFLKCLSSDDARLPQLIRDEIEAREWFILCDSPNARRSGWVQQERKLIKAMTGKVIETIDLSKDPQTELHKLIRLSKRATVFLSYARQDREIAERIRRALLEHDFGVWFDASVPAGQDWAVAIQSAIDDAVARGFVLVLLSPASLASQFCKHETEYALQLAVRSQRSNVIPVVVAPCAHEALPVPLGNIQLFDLTTGPFDERMSSLIHNLKTRKME